MSIEITADGQTIGHADSIVQKMEPDYIGSGAYPPYRVDSTRRIDLKGFNEASLARVDYKDLYEVRTDQVDTLLDQIFELQEACNRRGKTIEELTETFKAKKERIHAFYAPQLENRKRELKEFEDMSEFARNETLSANDWYLKADDLEEELRIATRSVKSERDSANHWYARAKVAEANERKLIAEGVELQNKLDYHLAVSEVDLKHRVADQADLIRGYEEQIAELERSRPAPVHDSVIQEYEEQISVLAQKASTFEESFKSAHRNRTDWAVRNFNLRTEKSELEKRNEHLEDQLEEVNAAVDQTVDLFNKTGTALNRASDAGDTE